MGIVQFTRSAALGLGSLVFFLNSVTVPVRGQTVASPPKGQSVDLQQFPAEVTRFLTAVPANAETVMVGRNFVFLTEDEARTWDSKTPPKLTSELVYSRIVVPQIIPSAKPPECVRDCLKGREIALMLTAGRGYRVASAFGYVYEAAGVFVLREPLGAARDQLRKNLAAERTATRTIAGHEVSVLPLDRRPSRDREGRMNVMTWEGRYVAILDERTIVTATSDRFLEQFLGRLDAKERPDQPSVFQLLNHISPEDDAWLIRIPAPTEQTGKLAIRQLFAALVWRWRTEKSPSFVAYYKPVEGRSVAEVRRAVESYFKRRGDGPLGEALWLEETDDAVHLKLDVARLKPDETPADAKILTGFSFLFLKYHQAMF